MAKLLPTVHALDLKVEVDTHSPNIEVPNEVVTFDGKWKSTKYLSAHAFDTKFSSTLDFSGELRELSEVWDLLHEGEKLISMLYTFRSCSAALKDVQTNSETPKSEKMEIYHTEFKIFQPEIKKLAGLMDFHERAVRCFGALIKSLVRAEQKKQVHSQLKLDLIVMLLDQLVKLDKLKDMKSNLVNDFARYKRAVALIRSELPNSEEIEEIVFKLQSFLCNPQNPHGLIVFNVKKAVEEVRGSPDVVCLLISHCRDALRTHRFLLPDEEHRFHRAVVYLIYILDSAKLNAFRYKNCNFGEVMRLFKETPVIPLFGDMQIQIKYDLDRCVHWTQDFKDRIDDTNAAVRRKYTVVGDRHAAIRQEYSAYTSRLCSLMNRVRAIRTKADVQHEIKATLCDEAMATVRDGLRIISTWNRDIRLQSAYKCSHPLDENTYRRLGGKGGKGHEYEKVVRYAYDERELSSLVDIIGMVKGLGSLLQRSEPILVDLCWRHIHNQMQNFVHAMVTRPLRKAYKANRKTVLNIMLALRAICGDYIPGQELKDDYKQRKAEILEIEYKFPMRYTPPSVDQVVLMRRMMNYICDDRADGMKGGMFKQRDLKKEWQEAWKDLYGQSFFFQYVLNFKQSLRDATDLSYLWYREFYLNMTKQPQFPINMSMPWILTKFVIQGVQMKENLFYPMEIYNDAAEVALSFLDQRYLFDEIEAEVNLAFDQLLIHLSTEIFKFFKTLAGTMLMDREYGEAFARLRSGGATHRVPVSRYRSLMAQQTVRLLGRVVNLQALLAQHVLANFRKNVDGVLAKFLSSPLSAAVETKAHIDNARLAHALASEHLPLDDFDTIYKEADARVSVSQGFGRVAAHVAEEVTLDLIPNWTYCSGTRRFVPSVVSYAEKRKRSVRRVRMPRYFWHGQDLQGPNSALVSAYRKFVGAEHLAALLDLLDAADLPYILREVLSQIENNIGVSLMPSMEKMQSVLQRAPIPLPKAHFGPALAYSALLKNNLVKAVRGWPALKTVFFQSVREIGNAFAFVHLLETVLQQRSEIRFSQLAFYLAATPHASSGHGQQAPLTPYKIDASSRSPLASVVSLTHRKLGGSETLHREMEANIATTEKLMRGGVAPARSIFAATLQRVRDILQKVEVFDGARPANGVLDTHSGSDFARVFSVGLFLFCCSPKEVAGGQHAGIDTKDGATPKATSALEEHAILGDGFLWGGASLVHLLGYSARFEMLDLCFHILNIDDMTAEPHLDADSKRRLARSEKDPDSAMMSLGSLRTGAMEQFMRNARATRKIIQFTFSTIKSFCRVNPIKDLRFSPPKPSAEHK